MKEQLLISEKFRKPAIVIAGLVGSLALLTSCSSPEKANPITTSTSTTILDVEQRGVAELPQQLNIPTTTSPQSLNIPTTTQPPRLDIPTTTNPELTKPQNEIEE